MNDITIISNVPCYEKDGTAYLKLEAVARGLGFTQEKNGVEYVRWETVKHYLDELGFPNKLGKSVPTCGDDGFIPENVFYRLAMKAKNEVAEKFQAKVADEIIPAIRKTGGYVNNEQTFVDTYLPFADEATKALFGQTLSVIRQQNAKIEQDKPKVLFSDAVSASSSSILVGDLAKLLRQNGVEIGQKRLFAWLRDSGYLIKSGSSKNMPTQRAMEMGLFKIKEGSYIDSGGNNVLTRTCKVTGKGQLYFVNKLMGGGNVAG